MKIQLKLPIIKKETYQLLTESLSSFSIYFQESGLLSLGTGSVSWWEGNGWGCQPMWGEVDGPGTWRPEHVDGCFLQWHLVELAQSAVAALLTVTALPITILLTFKSFKKHKTVSGKEYQLHLFFFVLQYGIVNEKKFLQIKVHYLEDLHIQ